jgi:beta-mannanase
VRFVWTPVIGGTYARYFPGAAYVDVIGLSGFNGGTAERWTGWRSFTAIYDGELRKLESLAPGKPVQIAEVGSAESGGSKAAWIAGMWRNLAGRRDIRSLIWFDLRKQTDWRIDSSAAAQRAFAAGARDRRYG